MPTRASLEISLAIGRPTYQLVGLACFAELRLAQGEVIGARRILAFTAEHPGVDQRDRVDIRVWLEQ